jgi:hypothetical protein
MDGTIRPEFHDASTLCKQREIISLSHEKPGKKTAAPLANDNAAGADIRTPWSFNAQALRI